MDRRNSKKSRAHYSRFQSAAIVATSIIKDGTRQAAVVLVREVYLTIIRIFTIAGLGWAAWRWFADEIHALITKFEKAFVHHEEIKTFFGVLKSLIVTAL